MIRGLRVALLAVLGVVTACEGRERRLVSHADAGPTLGALAAGTAEIAVFDLSAGAPEGTDGGLLLERSAKQTFVGLVRSIERVAADDDVTGVFVNLEQAELDWAHSEELGRLLGRLRKSRPVVCHAHAINNATAWLFLRGCDRVWLSAAGQVDSVGIAAQVVYLKGALDSLGVQADLMSVGEYKSGAEPLTREGPSDAARRNLTETLASIRKVWLDDAAKAEPTRGIRDALEHGPWTPKEALERGLIDEIGSGRDALDDAKRRGKTETTKVRFGPGRAPTASTLTGLVRALAGADVDIGARPRVAVVPALGAITVEAEGPFGGGGITSQALVKTLDRLREDDGVRAVVLRLDSPGGSPLASDIIWLSAMQLRHEKPLIVSVGGMAASGGYYIASAAQRIFSERTSIVGSIGVFGGKVVIGSALEKLGIHSFTFPASRAPGSAERAAYLSPLKPWDDATRERVRKQMQGIYDLFVERVAKGRGQSPASVRQRAEGRIYSGVQGKEHGLVDELGGLSDALAEAKRLAGLGADAPVSVEGLTESLLERLLLGESAESGVLARALERAQGRRAALAELIPAEHRAFVTSLEPLTGRERVTAALPFAFSLR